MPEWQVVALVCGIFALAGGVKGVLGFGLPLVSLGLLTITLGLQTALTLLILPALVSNCWQAAVGGNAARLTRRLWWFFLLAVLPIWAGTYMLAYARASAAVQGAVFIAYALTGLLGVRYVVSAQREKINGVFFSITTGIFTGMTGSFMFPSVLFLQGIGLPRDELVQAMGILFVFSTLALAAVLFLRGLLVVELGALSVVAIAPTLIGMAMGQWLRRRLSEERFRKVFFIGIIIMGSYIIIKKSLLAGG